MFNLFRIFAPELTSEGMKIYKFKPILKQTIWGGDKIAALKHLSDAPDHLGESWEVSGVEGDVSVVADGPYAGMSLSGLIDQEQGRMMGEHVYQRFGNRFPLLIKFIDAQRDLSIQVHPTDEQARAAGNPCGKTEQWVIMKGSAPDAAVRVGLQRPITPEQYRQMVADSTICDAVARYTVREGDCFFLPAGRIHSICSGSLLLEIQQTSDITYRIFDFNRRDKNGNLRQLHTEQAAACIDYRVEADYQLHYQAEPNQLTQLVSCPHFTTGILDLDGTQQLSVADHDSFLLVMVIDGSGTLQADDETPFSIQSGETVLIAANTATLTVSGQIKLVTAFIGL